jgi:hypothetical protein
MEVAMSRFFADIPNKKYQVKETFLRDLKKDGNEARGKVGSAYKKFYKTIRENPDDYEAISDCVFTIIGKTRQLIEFRAQAVRYRKELDRDIYGEMHNANNEEMTLFVNDFIDALKARQKHLLTFAPNSTEDIALRTHFLWLDKLGLQIAPNIMTQFYHQSKEEIETRVAEQEAWLKEDKIKKEEHDRRYDPEYYFDEYDDHEER